MAFDPYTGFQFAPEDGRVCEKCDGDYTARPGDTTPLCDTCLATATICDECDEPIVGAVTEFRDPIYGLLHGVYHANCLDNLSERNAERDYEDYHGGTLATADYAQAHQQEEARARKR